MGPRILRCRSRPRLSGSATSAPPPPGTPHRRSGCTYPSARRRSFCSAVRHTGREAEPCPRPAFHRARARARIASAAAAGGRAEVFSDGSAARSYHSSPRTDSPEASSDRIAFHRRAPARRNSLCDPSTVWSVSPYASRSPGPRGASRLRPWKDAGGATPAQARIVGATSSSETGAVSRRGGDAGPVGDQAAPGSPPRRGSSGAPTSRARGTPRRGRR